MDIDCVEFCRALSDETRQTILKMLQEREMSVGEIVEAFGTTQPTISHHLSVLKKIGLVRSRREGKQIFYSLAQDNIEECCGLIVANFSRRAGEGSGDISFLGRIIGAFRRLRERGKHG